MDCYMFICFQGKPGTCKLLLFYEYMNSSEFAEVRFSVYLPFYFLIGNKNPYRGGEVEAGFSSQSSLVKPGS